MLDPQDEVYDRRLANHLVSLYYRGDEEVESEHLVSLQLTYLCIRKINTEKYTQISNGIPFVSLPYMLNL